MFSYSILLPILSPALIVAVCLFAFGKFTIDRNEQRCEFLIAGVLPNPFWALVAVLYFTHHLSSATQLPAPILMTVGLESETKYRTLVPFHIVSSPVLLSLLGAVSVS